MVISVDFDGTCVTHEFPRTGRDIGAEIVLKALVNEGHEIICLSMRSEEHEETCGIDTIQAIKEWFSNHGIKLFAINDHPGQERWSKSRKVYASTYIDDQFLGCPLKIDNTYSYKPFVHWLIVTEILYKSGFLSIDAFYKVKKELEEKYPELYLSQN